MTCAVRISSAGAVAERDSRASNCRRVCLQGEDFRGEREMEQEREKKKSPCVAHQVSSAQTRNRKHRLPFTLRAAGNGHRLRGTQRLPHTAGAVTTGGFGRKHEEGLWEASPAASEPSARAGLRPLGPFPPGQRAPRGRPAGFWCELTRIPRGAAPRSAGCGAREALARGAVVSLFSGFLPHPGTSPERPPA